MQYGIRLSHEPDISVSEYYRLLAGIMPDTPLGRIVQIRMENDPKVIKNFGNYEKNVRKDWAEFKRQKDKVTEKVNAEEAIKRLQEALARMFS